MVFSSQPTRNATANDSAVLRMTLDTRPTWSHSPKYFQADHQIDSFNGTESGMEWLKTGWRKRG